MLLSTLGNTEVGLVQGKVEGRGSGSPAFSVSGLPFYQPTNLPNIPRLPGHSLYMITPGGSEGVAFNDAIGDIISIASWLVAAISVTPEDRGHLHLLALLPDSCVSWLSRHPVIYRDRWHRWPLPQVVYSRGGTVDPCDLVFSKVENLSGCLDYLTGPRNRATFITLLDVSPTPARRAVMARNDINNIDTPSSRLLDGLGVEPWERDAGAARKAALLRNGTAPRLDGEKKKTKKTLPHRRPGGSGRRVLDVFRPKGCGFPHGANDMEHSVLCIRKRRPPRKLSTCTGRLSTFSYYKEYYKECWPVYVVRVSGYI